MTYSVAKLLEVAEAEEGYLEKASNDQLDSKTANAGKGNFTKYARDLDAISGFYNGKKNGYPWCDVFVDWLFVKAFGVEAALKLTCQPKKSAGAGCTYSARYYEEKDRLFDDPKPGDQIFFGSRDGNCTHTGIVYKVDSKKVYTVEGNTSGASGVVANGGGVFKKSYSLSYNRIYGYGRPDYGEETVTKPTTGGTNATETVTKPTETEQNELRSRATYPIKLPLVQYGDSGPIVETVQQLLKLDNCDPGTVDGEFGNRTKAAVEVFQKACGLDADGKVGGQTWPMLLGLG